MSEQAVATEAKTAHYEAMFLIGQAEAVDLAGVVDHIVDIITRSGGEIVAMKKWDERRLAYPIEKQRRGVYLLTYFKAEGGALTRIDRDCNLSERIMRVLVLRADHLTVDQMLAADAREELATEAKLRAEREAERADRGGGVKLGGAAKPEEEAPAEDSGEAAAEAPVAEAAPTAEAVEEKPAEG
ncbi:MAG: 30S ribosomal protein S6 [Planctomycetota bacterium]